MSRIRSSLRLHLAILAATAFTALALLPGLASAAEITVNTTNDEAPSPGECEGGVCSLRQAINKANNTLGRDTIVLPAGTYHLTLKGSGENEGATGDLDITEESGIQIIGAGARTTVVDASGLEDRVFDVRPLGVLELSKLTVTGGLAIGEYGGGIDAAEAALALDQVAVRGNVASENGRGGGIAVEETETRIKASLIANNRNSGDGGGIWTNKSELLIENTTIADNEVDTSLYPTEPGWGAFGGAMEVSGGHLGMQNVTIAGNTIHDGNGGTEGSGAAISGGPKTAAIVNTIIYGNVGKEVTIPGQCDETLESEGHNLEQQPPEFEGTIERCFGPGTALIADPLLGSLANNGGETDTMALLGGSPAINAGDPGKCPATDQRGLPRPQLGGCDIGAFEVQPVPPPPPPVVFKPTITRKGKVKVKKAGKTFLVKPGFLVTCSTGGPSCTGTIRAIVRFGKSPSPGAKIAAKKVAIGSAKFTIAAGRSKKPSLKLNSKGAKMLLQTGKLGALFAVNARAGTGPVVTTKAALMLKLPAKRRHKG
jgi:CSLREA domain-containing protein